MPEWSEKDMDKLFQDGSERYDFEYNPDAWQQMDALLDQQERRRRLLWWIWSGLGISFLAILIYLFVFNKNTAPLSAPHAEQTVTPITAAPQPTDNQTEKQNITSSALNETGQNITENESDETLQQEQSSSNILSNTGEREVDAKSPPPVQQAASKNAPSPLTTKKPEDKLPKEADVSQTVSDIGEEINQSETKRKQVSTDQLPLPGIPLFPYNYLPAFKLLTYDTPSKKDRDKKKSNSFLIGLSGASEFNSVGQGDYSEQNWKLGAHLEYRFGQRFALRSGVSFINMWYDAGAGEYIPEKGFWVDGIAPESTRGQCHMWEIPITLSYHFKGYQQDGFFVTAGVASYFITEEHYWYNYDDPPPDPVWYWGTDETERNWFNIGLLAGGYNKRFSNKWSAQIGPYMQLPLMGVGHGEVKIYSLGLQGVVNFRLMQNEK